MTTLLLGHLRIAIKRAESLFTVYLTFDPVIAITADTMAAQIQSSRKNKMKAQTQCEEGKNKEIIHSFSFFKLI